MPELWKPKTSRKYLGDNTRYYRGKPKKDVNPLRSRLFIQSTAVLLIFIFIWVVFQFSGPYFNGMQGAIRTWFTKDTDLTPVVNVIKSVGLFGDSFERAGYEVISPNVMPESLEPMTIPVSGTVTKPYGWTMVEGQSSFHNGIEIEAPEGTFIKAAYGGTVLEIRDDNKWGRIVVISHKDGMVTTYGYCGEILVKADQIVEQGQVIAKVGQDGDQGKLYFEAKKLGEPVNPLELLGNSQNI
ncbi:MAG: M23 family metallopeptidase [Peptococcaceae bacterium]